MPVLPLTMKAIFLVKFGDSKSSFEYREVKLPKPKHSEVLIKVQAFGLNFAEVMARKGLYRDSPPLPFIPGYDCVGEVVEVGSNADKNLINKRVAALSKFGAYAEYTCVSENMLVEIEDSMPAEVGTAIGVQYNTAYHMACQATNLNEGDRVLIRAAAGGVGTALIQLCKWKSCEIIALVGSEEKKRHLIKEGVEKTFNYKDEIQMRAMNSYLKENPLDVAFNPVAGKTFKRDMKNLRAGGRLILFGASERTGMKGLGADLRLLYNMGLIIPIFLVGQSKSIVGVNMLKIAQAKPKLIQESMRGVLELYNKGVVEPQIPHIFQASEIVSAHELLESGNSTGKIALKW